MLAIIPEFFAYNCFVSTFLQQYSALFTPSSRGVMPNEKQALETVANTLGNTFTEKDSYGLGAQLKQFDLFRHERKTLVFAMGKITNIMRSTVGDTEVFFV